MYLTKARFWLFSLSLTKNILPITMNAAKKELRAYLIVSEDLVNQCLEICFL